RSFEISDQYVEEAFKSDKLGLFKISTYESANDYQKLVQSVLNIERDVELLSSNAAEILALGPTSRTSPLFNEVWNGTEKSGCDVMNKSLDAIGAPGEVAKTWNNLLVHTGCK